MPNILGAKEKKLGYPQAFLGYGLEHKCFFRRYNKRTCQLDDSLLACLHDQNKSGFFGGPAFFQPIRAF